MRPGKISTVPRRPAGQTPDADLQAVGRAKPDRVTTVRPVGEIGMKGRDAGMTLRIGPSQASSPAPSAVDRQLAGHEGHGRVHVAVQDRAEHVGDRRSASRRPLHRRRARRSPSSMIAPSPGMTNFATPSKPPDIFALQRLHGCIDHFAHPSLSIRDPAATGNPARICVTLTL